MFQAWRYSQLPASDPEISAELPAKTTLRRWLRPKPLAVIFSSLLFVVFLFHSVANMRSPRPPFAFDIDPRPKWLDKDPIGGPLVLRVAVMSAPYEFEKREAIRDTIFRGVRESDVNLEYRFFTGSTTDESILPRLSEEMDAHKDIISLDGIPDMPERLSEKRYAALKWGGSVQSNTYDYFMTMDTDTFVRFGTLAKRLPIFLKKKHRKPIQLQAPRSFDIVRKLIVSGFRLFLPIRSKSCSRPCVLRDPYKFNSGCACHVSLDYTDLRYAFPANHHTRSI
ncbi:hypothetical protein BDQ17DRAFT_1327874 [Cyathus striatus]|nr:hypothetical protein BDQ17DRAFT_1327874 [Cyathus striatus]